MIFKHRTLAGSTGKVYDYLFNAIVYNHLKPGEPLSEADIAAKLEISRTPVREAMMMLETEGLVVRYPSRGCFVSQIAVRDVEEIFELRIQLELLALRNSCRLISEEQLAALQDKLESLTTDAEQDAYFASDRELHGLLLSYCGNNRLVDFLGVLNAQIERLRVVSAGRPKRLQESCAEHIDIVKAMRARNIIEAEALLAVHIGHVRDSTIEVCKYMYVAHV